MVEMFACEISSFNLLKDKDFVLPYCVNRSSRWKDLSNVAKRMTAREIFARDSHKTKEKPTCYM